MKIWYKGRFIAKLYFNNFMNLVIMGPLLFSHVLMLSVYFIVINYKYLVGWWDYFQPIKLLAEREQWHRHRWVEQETFSIKFHETRGGFCLYFEQKWNFLFPICKKNPIHKLQVEYFFQITGRADCTKDASSIAPLYSHRYSLKQIKLGSSFSSDFTYFPTYFFD